MEITDRRRKDMKKPFESPEYEIQCLTVTDIVTTSEKFDSNENWTPWK